jgi:predicted AAA+ superfamily ATPase
MELDKFLNKTDIQLYRGILHKIYKDFDNMEPSVLGDLLDKLKELHNELDKVVQQKNTQQMYNTPYVKRLDLLKIKKDKEDLEKMKNRNKNPGTKIKIINNDTEIMFENMKSLINEYNFSAHLIRKYRDTGEKILERDLNQENIFLLGCIIETIKT